MKRLAAGIAAALLISACSGPPDAAGPAGANPAPSTAYEHPEPQNPGWEYVRSATPLLEDPPPPADPSLTVEQLVQGGITYLRSQEPGLAVSCLREAVRQDPANSRAAYFLGAAYEAKGELAKAAGVYAEALKRLPDDPDLKRAAAALANDFTMDGTPDRIEIRGSFFCFFDGANGQQLLEYQPWQGEENLTRQARVVSPAIPPGLLLPRTEPVPPLPDRRRRYPRTSRRAASLAFAMISRPSARVSRPSA